MIEELRLVRRDGDGKHGAGGNNTATVNLSTDTDGLHAYSYNGYRIDQLVNGTWQSTVVLDGVANLSITGGSGNDSLTGSSGNSTFIGNGGDDSLSVSSGTSSLSGGDGNDYIQVTGSGIATIDGGTGNDSLYLDRSTLTAGVALTVNPNSSAVQILPDGTTFANIEHITLYTGSGDDSVTFNQPVWDSRWGGSYWNAGGGNNMATVNLSNDTAGLNTYNYNGYHIDQIVNGNWQSTVVLAGVANLNITGGSGNDSLTGSIGNSILTGNGGNDYLSVSSGTNILTGGAGNDTLLGGSGVDTAVFSGNHSDYAVSYNAATQTYTIADQRTGSPDGTDTATGIEQFQFSGGVFTYNGSAQVTSQTVTNSDGSKFITTFDAANAAPWSSQTNALDPQGSLASQTINNDNGTRWINIYDTTNSANWLWKTDSYDSSGRLTTEVVTNDNDTHSLTLYDVANQYSWANVTLAFDTNWNQTALTGTNDNGTHTVTMSAIAAALDTALWFATPYDANFNAAPANLVLTGGANNDILYGGAGNDTISGGAGDDLIVGGAGNDVLTGGSGNDRFVFTDGDGHDTIADFTHGSDVVELHAYGISSFIALLPFMSQIGGDTVLTFDPANQITLHGVQLAQLGASDFSFH